MLAARLDFTLQKTRLFCANVWVSKNPYGSTITLPGDFASKINCAGNRARGVGAPWNPEPLRAAPGDRGRPVSLRLWSVRMERPGAEERRPGAVLSRPWRCPGGRPRGEGAGKAGRFRCDGEDWLGLRLPPGRRPWQMLRRFCERVVVSACCQGRGRGLFEGTTRAPGGRSLGEVGLGVMGASLAARHGALREDCSPIFWLVK
jgi:hypothetical protein